VIERKTSMVTRGALQIDPNRNPAVLDTRTWDPEAAGRAVRAQEDSYWPALSAAGASGAPLPPGRGLTPHGGSLTCFGGARLLLAGLADGQEVLLSIGGPVDPLGDPQSSFALADGTRVAVYPTVASLLDRFFRYLQPSKGPRALGATPRLGIGCRMSTMVWPGVWRAMNECGFAANAIQNSLRELSLLTELEAGLPPRSNYQFSFGAVQEGHTGSTFEGLWTEGVLSALRTPGFPRYGADADHIMVKRTPDGLERAKRIIEAGRYYSFFTLDVSDLLDYGALAAGDGSARLEAILPDPEGRRLLVAYHHDASRAVCRARHGSPGTLYAGEAGLLGPLVAKYWKALDAADSLARHLVSLKKSARFDLELSIDENPADVRTCDCLTSEQELVFLLLEAQRRGLPLTHVAPNFGIEKGTDYRCSDGLAGLEKRAEGLYRVAERFGVMLDCHSGDDLSRETMRTMGRASKGRIHFKVSPSLQVIFGEVLFEHARRVFDFWFDDAVAHAQAQESAGSELARAALRELERDGRKRHPRSPVFHHFAFASVGRRDERNRFFNRERFYDLPQGVAEAYTERIARFLGEVASDVFDQD
jgi:hypothetical protein